MGVAENRDDHPGVAAETDMAISLVSPYAEESEAWFERSRRHLASAELLAASDPVARGLLSWEAVRTCAIAVLLRSGLWVYPADDQVFDDTVKHQLRPPLETLQEFRRLRERHNDDQPPLGPDGARASVEAARRVIDVLTA